MRTVVGRAMFIVSSAYQSVTVTVCVASYSAVWFKIRQVSKSAGSWSTRQKKLVKKARIMAVFVLAYAGQWVPGVILALWSFISPENVHEIMVLITTLFVNMGGFFNCVAYTVIRKKYSG